MGARNDTEARARRVVERLRQFFARAGTRRERTDSDPKLRRYELFERWCVEYFYSPLAAGVPAETMLRTAAKEDREAWHALLMALIVADAHRRATDIAHVSQSLPSTPTTSCAPWMRASGS